MMPLAAAAVLWTATQLKVLDGFDVPESVLPDPSGQYVYVANVETSTVQYWAEDGKGFLSRLKPDGAIETLRWKDSTKDFPLNSPKGLCILDGWLYVADITRVLKFPLAGDARPEAVAVPGAKMLNDLATDGKAVYASDTGTGKVHRLGQGAPQTIKGPPGVNGITFFDGRMYAVSWSQHDIYELDPSGKEDAKPFGLASCFRNLDGIEVLEDGTFLVTDNTGGEVLAVGPDRRTLTHLARLDTPADIGLDRRTGTLYVPQFGKNKVTVFRLEKTEVPQDRRP